MTGKEESHTHTHTPVHTQPPLGFGLDIPIFSKLYVFYKILYQYTKLFPKKDRYSLGQKIDNLTIDLFSLIIQAGISKQQIKIEALNKAVVQVDILKILLRLAKDINALETKKYLQLQQMVHEIGRMIGG